MTSVSFIFNNVPKLRLCYNLPPGIHIWSDLLCVLILKHAANGPETTTDNWLRVGWKSRLKTNLLLSDFECWYCSAHDRKNHLLSERSGFCIERGNKMEGREDQSTHAQSLAQFSFLPHVYWMHPDFLSAHQADSNSSRETQNQRDIGSSLPLSLCLSLSAPE